ncbi:hypothetical protein N7466_010558 [Penicillium verhagenii]|uniref:uncharacterized protein n=1 Tax=Penicillium verhagenii TaxID=1562060 RepID=UPI0025452F94|nr:uncharacterized protein N7466_010558 [Penicillium verhagenii]KAJ5918566.1 hypothetical protein N7466_010558 [Penicillium verhagenii]
MFTDYFLDNKTKAVADSSRASSPGLWLAFHDPVLDIRQALESGNTQMHLIAANGEVAINLGITRSQKEGQSLFYDYELAISSVQASDLVCDIGTEGYYACYVSLLIQFPTFARQTFRTEPVLDWKDVVAAAGAWFSFFQIIGWVFSGASIKE